MSTVETLALMNASMNAASAFFAISAWRAVRRREVPRHRALMLTAFTFSTLFLAGYLTRIALFGDTHFLGTGALRIAYFVLLGSHVLLALAVVPLVLRTLYLALRKRFDQHRRIARVTFPIWVYVSVTGVLVYLMLYRLPT